MRNDTDAETGPESGEMLLLVALGVFIAVGVSVLGELLDLSGIQSVKIAVAYIILAGMIIDRVFDHAGGF